LTNVFRTWMDLQYYFGNFEKNENKWKTLFEVGKIILAGLSKWTYYKDYWFFRGIKNNQIYWLDYKDTLSFNNVWANLTASLFW
jgi:hypothetical protein